MLCDIRASVVWSLWDIRTIITRHVRCVLQLLRQLANGIQVRSFQLSNVFLISSHESPGFSHMLLELAIFLNCPKNCITSVSDSHTVVAAGVSNPSQIFRNCPRESRSARKRDNFHVFKRLTKCEINL